MAVALMKFRVDSLSRKNGAITISQQAIAAKALVECSTSAGTHTIAIKTLQLPSFKTNRVLSEMCASRFILARLFSELPLYIRTLTHIIYPRRRLPLLLLSLLYISVCAHSARGVVGRGRIISHLLKTCNCLRGKM